MVSYTAIALGTALLYYFGSLANSLRRNIATAKSSGLPWKISIPAPPNGIVWSIFQPLILRTCQSLPYIRDTTSVILLDMYKVLRHSDRVREELGELFLLVDPWHLYLNNNNAEAMANVTSRWHDFPKPTEVYSRVDLYGKSIMTTEGDEWKRHRKIVAPAFAERSNMMVWKESLRQAQGMLQSWSRMAGNNSDNMLINDAARGTERVALHVISGAGFGVSQLWDGEDEKQLGKNVVPGFNTAMISNSHTFTFIVALHELMAGVIWTILFPMWLLEKSPFQLHKKVVTAYYDCAQYFQELSDYKVSQKAKGESLSDAMDVMGPLVTAAQKTPEDSKGLYLTKREVIADSWLILFAGHETSANTIHYAFVFLAIALETQAELQHQVDAISGDRPIEEWTYQKDMGLLYNSLVGASANETLRLQPPVPNIPKCVRETAQMITFEGKECIIPAGTFMHLDTAAIGRNPRYWPNSPSKVTNSKHDCNDFVPQRWLSKSNKKPTKAQSTANANNQEYIDDIEAVSYEKASGGLFKPVKGAYMPFSDGPRSCPGRRFAQVEMTAVLAVIFKIYSIELDVSDWASDAEVDMMGKAERKAIYEKAKVRARDVIQGSRVIIAFKMMGKCPLRFVKRGKERFMDCYTE